MNAVRLIEVLSNARKVGLTSYNHLQTIAFLFTEEAPQRMSDLAAFLGVAPPVITDVANYLEKLDLISRSIDPEDRRSILISLTKRGCATYLAITEHTKQKLRFSDHSETKKAPRILSRGYIKSTSTRHKTSLSHPNG